MEQKLMLKQILEFNKTSFDNTFHALNLVQKQIEKMVTSTVDQNPWVPEEGKKAIHDWVKSCDKGSEDFKKLVDESFAKVESYFG
jgi:hypothetical protein